MIRQARLRSVWIRRFTRALPALLVVGAITLALGLDLRYRAVRRLPQAQNDFEAAFGSEAFGRVRTSVSRPPELARRLTDAAASTKLSSVESQRLVKLANSNASPDVLAPWRERCDRLLAVMDRARQASPAAMPEPSGPPAPHEHWRPGGSMHAINSARACGLAAAAQGDRTTGIVAVELLGALARSLEAWPLRLSLLIGAYAEKAQLNLVERLREGAGVQERSRLLAALSGDDLASRHRDALAGEVVYTMNGWYPDPRKSEQPLDTWYFGPFETRAQVREYTRFLQGDQRSPSWPDSEFVGSEGVRPLLEDHQAQLAELSARREAERRQLAD
jgi:hypothetical protein